MKALADMFIKQTGSYARLSDIIKSKYPMAKIKRTETLTIDGNGILVMFFEIK
jgi:hypothetical protein